MIARQGLIEPANTTDYYQGKMLSAANQKLDGCFILDIEFWKTKKGLCVLAPTALQHRKIAEHIFRLKADELVDKLISLAKDFFSNLKRKG